MTFCAPTSVKLNPESADYIRSKYYGASSLSSLSCFAALSALLFVILSHAALFSLYLGGCADRVVGSDGHDPYSTPTLFSKPFFFFSNCSMQFLNYILLEQRKRRGSEHSIHPSFFFSRSNRKFFFEGSSYISEFIYPDQYRFKKLIIVWFVGTVGEVGAIAREK